ncbi:hypothetical protein M8C21_000490 [Ambrosia artemisiifolia]|uniref:Uncharacterized protein n=1 Tax=Ambrosia artemisiifolia TaxID=4212 RepID=A0AAD5C9P2_AMBAR|nr:hypothetical protein M8C21_000490 [Ambrosia artemisiifolia]
METSLKGLASVTVVTVGVIIEDNLGFHHEPLAATMVFQGSRKVQGIVYTGNGKGMMSATPWFYLQRDSKVGHEKDPEGLYT